MHPKLSKKDTLTLAYTIDCLSLFWPKKLYLEAKIDSFLSEDTTKENMKKTHYTQN